MYIHTGHLVVDTYHIGLETHACRLTEAKATTSDLKAILKQNPHKSGSFSGIVI